MKPNNLDLATIHPRNGAKFSPNLHDYLVAQSRKLTGRYAHVYRDLLNVLWLGYKDDDCFVGTRLTRVLCYGRKAETFAYLDIGPLTEVENFWADYQSNGRCAIDTDHTMYFLNDDSRWATNDSERSCLWCGKVHQRQETMTENVLVTHTSWINRPTPAAARV